MKKPGKGLVLTLNLALPGLGQIVSGRWLAGGVMMLLAVAFFLLGVYFVDPASAAEYKINLVNVFASFGLLALVWIICIADGLRSGGKNKEHDHE